MKHACSKKQLLLEAASTLHTHGEVSLFIMYVHFGSYRHTELGCTAKLTEVTGLSQAIALARPSVVWFNVTTLARPPHCYRVSGFGYPGPASCRRGHCRIKMVDSTDIRKCRE